MRNNAQVKQLLYFLKKNYFFILVFVLLGSFLVHNFDSIGQDIGRHLKIGDIIWQTKEVPKTNLFSFTEPSFRFINHHWLSEVIFFGIFSWFGFVGLILFKVFVVFATFLLLFIAIKSLWITGRVPQEWVMPHSENLRSRLSIGFWPLAISFLLSIFIFTSRTEVRPEIFSFAILSFFLSALFKAKYPVKLQDKGDALTERRRLDDNYLWFLPILELFWVNLHIYFFIGPFLVLVFLVDRLINKNYANVKEVITILFLTLVATLVNPAGIHGALLPFGILKEYGYSIVENQTLFFLADFFGFNLNIFVFKLSVFLLTVSFLITIRKSKQRMFEILVSAFFVYSGFKMFRNLPLYALASFPILAVVLTDIQDFIKNKFKQIKSVQVLPVRIFLKTAVFVFLVFMIFFVASGRYYKKAGLSRVVGLSVPNGLERAVNFVKENKIKGPMFNNFDIGGYLIWGLYPDYKVFVDNRPEAYSVKFFSEIYKPMQENKEKWAEFSEKYGINFIFFGHSDSTPWGQIFVASIVKNSDWKTVYVNEEAIILVKNNKDNSNIISRFSILEKNAIDKTLDFVESSNEDSANLNIILSRFFYNISWRETSIYFADEAIKIDPQNPQPYLYKGLAHAYYTDENNQKLAGENIKKAIDLGLKESRYYYILGVIYMNLGRFDKAKELLEEAVRLDKNNMQAKELLNKYLSK